MVIPEQTIILLSGMPGTGKSTFARYLACQHGFAHYDLEHYPCGWIHSEPELKRIWENSRAHFVANISQYDHRVVLDWGFPVSQRSLVEELRSQGVRLIWFDGDVDRARGEYVKRELRALSGATESDLIKHFNQTWGAIRQAGYPTSLGCETVQALPASGAKLNMQQIESIVFR